jgi:hemerythrin-like metal-binding protein
MALIEWSDTLSVGIQTIDEQHKQLVAIINELHDAMMARQSREVLGTTFDRLVAYTEYHFGEEAKLFEKHGYAETREHLAAHDALTGRVRELNAEFKEGNAAISMELMDFLRDWLRNHIIGTDKKYAPFLKSKGVV